jgi:hypothetical protein
MNHITQLSRAQIREIREANYIADELKEAVNEANQASVPDNIDVDLDQLSSVLESYTFLFNALTSTGLFPWDENS